LIHPDDVKQIFAYFKAFRSVGDDAVLGVEFRTRHAEGGWRWLYARSVIFNRTVEGLPRQILGVAIDISDRKQSEQALQESEAWTRLATQVAQLGAWRLHLATNLVEFDQRMRQIWGEPADAVVTPLPVVLDRIHPDDRDRVVHAVNQALDPTSSGTYEVEYRIVWRDGTERWVLAKGQAQFEGEGTTQQAVDFFGTALDITDRKRAEQALQQQAEDLAQANRVKDEFIAVLSHELRSPLNPILGWTKLLQTGNFNPDKTKRALEIIERNAKQQTQLIDDLLDISKILRGKLRLNEVPVNLTLPIEAALETVRLAAEAKRIQITTHLDSTLPPVLGDEGRLQQIVLNLLSNAIKFTPNGGQVEVRLESYEFSVLGSQLEAQTQNSELKTQNPTQNSKLKTQNLTYAQIRVKDTGKGITPDFLPYVFESFRQEDSKITRRFGGLGLGLAIVRQLTELHGGTVHAASQGEGTGATFTIRLPLMEIDNTDLNASPQTSNSVDETNTLQEVRVLVVDDEPDMRDLVVTILERSGATAQVATSATEALLLFDQFQPTILVSDIGMPEMDGYSLIQQIRTRSPEQGGDVLAIALTAYAGELNQQQAYTAGFQHHLAKPVEPEALVKTITTLLNQK